MCVWRDSGGVYLIWKTVQLPEFHYLQGITGFSHQAMIYRGHSDGYNVLQHWKDHIGISFSSYFESFLNNNFTLDHLTSFYIHKEDAICPWISGTFHTLT